MLTVFVALLPLVIASFFQASASWRDTRALAASQLASTARAVAERARDPFAIARHSLVTVSALPAVRDISAGCNEGLAAGRTNDRLFNNFVRSDASGAVRCSVLPFDPATNLSVNQWWREGVTKGGLTLSPPTIGQVSQQRVFIVMLALRDATGRPDGAVSAGIKVDDLRSTVLADPAAARGYVALLDRMGNIIFESRRLGFTPAAIRGDAGNNVAEDFSGQEWSYAIAPIYTGDLSILYAEPRQEIMSVALSNIRYSVLFPLLAILFACVAIWLGSHFFVLNWLRRLQAVSGRFTQGDYSRETGAFAGAPREVRETGEDLHDMAEAIEGRDRQLTAALETQTQLTREVHHRVKNNLQIVTSLLTLQSARLKDPAAREALGQTRARISALGLIYRLLYEDGADSEKGNVPLDTLIAELCAQLRSAQHSRPDVQLDCAADHGRISIDDAIPLTLFVVEAVTNAYRHAFPEGRSGRIWMKLKTENGVTTLCVEDNGVGFEPDQAAGQMGTDLMLAFASQLNGKFESGRSSSGGTRVALILSA